MPQRLDFQQILPAGARALGAVYMLAQHSGLAQTLIDLVYLRASQVNGCAYCIDMHSRDLIKAGVPMEKILLLPVWHEIDGVFDARERAALQWTEAVTRVAESGVPEAAFAQVSSQFDEKSIADLTLAIGLINVYNRLAIAFRRTPESVAAAS
ncbi:carboxymuconolactone decarboxylase family protein [Rudaea sp.]|uniref:carboxymuconolactone decarboxylase family protein n=1 Tax=Rudaea sp. TaxID=2136325 RepID=UPI00321F9295